MGGSRAPATGRDVPGRPPRARRRGRRGPPHGRPRPGIRRARSSRRDGCERSRSGRWRSRFFPDPLPAALVAEEALPPLADALLAAHQPRERAEAEVRARGWRFRSFSSSSSASAVAAPKPRTRSPRLSARTASWSGATASSCPSRSRRSRRADREIGRDLGQPRANAAAPPGRRRLGEDGRRALRAPARRRGRHQGALMAPTETLAEQHFLTVEPICSDLGVRVQLLTSSLGQPRRRGAATGWPAAGDLVVGTHALIQESVAFRSLAVAVVDEQHRFGVEQRRALRCSTAACPPHDGDADPADAGPDGLRRPRRDRDRPAAANRKPIVTRWVRRSARWRPTSAAAQAPRGGRQAYVVCPLVSESEASEARAAEQEAERLRHAELRGFRVGCLTAARTQDRRALMDAFKRRELDVLVATTVIEVGVDVPNATIMIVQEADRFGLAQLHQLRGRVGRGGGAVVLPPRLAPKEELTETAPAAPGARRDDGRLQARRGRPRAPRRGPAPRHAPVRAPRPAVREPDARPGARGSARAWAERLVGCGPGRAGRWSTRSSGSLPMRIIAGSRKGARLFAPRGPGHAPDGRPGAEAASTSSGPWREWRCSICSRARVRWGSRRSRAAPPA